MGLAPVRAHGRLSFGSSLASRLILTVALKATIFKAELAVADIDRGYYGGHALTIAPVADGSLSIRALRSGATEPEVVERSAAWVAAALLHYCFKRRIPIPRQGNKRIELVTDAIDLVIATTVQVLPIELQTSEAGRAPAATAGGTPERLEANLAAQAAPTDKAD